MHVGVSVETYDGVFELFWLASMCTFSLVKIFWILYFKKRSHRVRRFILLLSLKREKKAAWAALHYRSGTLLGVDYYDSAILACSFWN